MVRTISSTGSMSCQLHFAPVYLRTGNSAVFWTYHVALSPIPEALLESRGRLPYNIYAVELQFHDRMGFNPPRSLVVTRRSLDRDQIV